MKTIIHAIFTFSLLLIIHQTFAQSTTLNVGDKAPDLFIYKWIKGNPVTEWKKNKYYLVEFGATWCKPCAAAIPKLTDLQNEFNNELTIISLFVMEKNPDPRSDVKDAYVSGVEKYIAKRGSAINYHVGVDDPANSLQKKWLQAAGRSGIPYVFLIDGNAIIRWMGDPASAKAAFTKIKRTAFVPTGSQPSELTKSLPKYDPSKLLLIENNGGYETDFFFRSLLTRFDGKIRGNSLLNIQNSFQLKPDSLYDVDEDKFEAIGAPIARLYYMAYSDTLPNMVPSRLNHKYPDTVARPYTKTTYGKYWHEPILEVSDKTPFEYSTKSTRNRFNYSLKVPTGKGTAEFLQQTMQRDLETYFGYTVTVENRIMPCWKLSAPDKEFALSKLKSKDQKLEFNVTYDEGFMTHTNAVMFDIISRLAMNFGYPPLDYGKLPRSEQAAFIDATGITEKIDFDFDDNMTFEQMREALRKLGLELSRSTKMMKVVVIKD